MRPSPAGPARAALASLCAAAVLAAAGPAHAAADTVLTYQFRLGGFDVARADLAVDLPEAAGGAYSMTSDLVADGLLGTFTSFTSRSAAAGTLGEADGRAEPHSFRSDSTWRGEQRTAVLSWQTPPLPEARVEPPPDPDEREPVPPHLTEGSVDPLSALLTLIAAATGDAASGATGDAASGATGDAASGVAGEPVTVYDGRRLYRLTVAGFAPAAVSAGGFAGEGWRADVRYETLAGTSRRWNSRKEVTADVLLAPGETFGLDVPVPVRIIVPVKTLGALVVELAGARPGDA
ncbi:DUF3108 domain-containing protein [Caenispirillum bisanense]|uniref:DUF3108 domain-containing protein n=1 Tax=Caenispirillum bisanense TaxID=414052 RepID=A0A286G2F5_9PROT|nr:DUF3108 domain-containing protein [Caenispirillum bisanense]SOD89642.1 Protein of unknown function [Caenispirillum bisanense]